LDKRPRFNPTKRQVERGEEPGLEYGDESEEELEAVESLGDDFDFPRPTRFRMLHRLWVSGVPRARGRPGGSLAGGPGPGSAGPSGGDGPGGLWRGLSTASAAVAPQQP
jgi:hypothetical protein